MSKQINENTKNIILGIASTSLSREEIEFLQIQRPWGIILFARNIDTTEQLRNLILEINEVLPYKPMIGTDVEPGLMINRLKFLDVPPEKRSGADKKFNPKYQSWLDQGKLGEKYETTENMCNQGNRYKYNIVMHIIAMSCI